MTHRPHEEGRRTCWCLPEVMQPCPEICDAGTDCWKCGGRGVVPFFDPGQPVIIVHRDTHVPH